MFAIVRTGGKQYKVSKGDQIRVEKIDGESGSKIDIAEVLMVGDDNKTTTGTPTVSGAKVSAEVVEQGKNDKILVFKKKRRQNYRRKRGHRQAYTVLKITDIKAA